MDTPCSIDKEHNPENFWHADGLNHMEYKLLLKHLPDVFQKKLTFVEELAEAYLKN